MSHPTSKGQVWPGIVIHNLCHQLTYSYIFDLDIDECLRISTLATGVNEKTKTLIQKFIFHAVKGNVGPRK